MAVACCVCVSFFSDIYIYIDNKYIYLVNFNISIFKTLYTHLLKKNIKKISLSFFLKNSPYVLVHLHSSRRLKDFYRVDKKNCVCSTL